QHEGYFETDRVILNLDQITKTTPEPSNFRTKPTGGRSPPMIWLSTGPMHDGSSVESGFEPGALQPQGRGLATRPPPPPHNPEMRYQILDHKVPGSKPHYNNNSLCRQSWRM
ncbi:hypothetical protein AVEN_130428-1, partial [Araneus ventricosus]